MKQKATARALQVISYAAQYGAAKAKADLGLTDETFKRYERMARKTSGARVPERSHWLDEISTRFTDQELQAIAKGARLLPGVGVVPVVSFSGKQIRIGCITDTHIGHKLSPRGRLMQAFEEFKKEQVDFITHSGDVTEGMSNRPGQVYELDHIGYDAQKREAIDIFSQWTDTDIFAIDGNHDRWFLKSNGALIVKDIADTIDNFHFLGHDEGDISLDGRAILKLWHGEDASSYALSYRIQKILESFSGGEKPNVLVTGHVHKYVNIFERNVWCVSAGCMQSQTAWMRGKRLAAHVGFCIITIHLAQRGVSKFNVTWYPFYA